MGKLEIAIALGLLVIVLGVTTVAYKLVTRAEFEIQKCGGVVRCLGEGTATIRQEFEQGSKQATSK